MYRGTVGWPQSVSGTVSARCKKRVSHLAKGDHQRLTVLFGGVRITNLLSRRQSSLEDTFSETSQTMNAADMKCYKERLLMLRARLRDDVSAMTDAALGHEVAENSAMPIHMAELGSDNFEQEFTLSLLATEEGTLELIESALDRIEKNTYGKCESCGGTIPKTRLNALPHTPMCVKCASQRDSRDIAS